MAKIREYMTDHPKEGRALRLKNHSFVFFKETPLKPNQEPVGAEGIPLTPGRSLAVDYKHHVYGTPIWIDAKFPIKSTAPDDKFQHLMFAQDTGGAIRGVARADIYFGHGEGIGSDRRPYQAVRQVRHAGAEGRLGGDQPAASHPAAQAAAAGDRRAGGDGQGQGARGRHRHDRRRRAQAKKTPLPRRRPRP